MRKFLICLGFCLLACVVPAPNDVASAEGEKTATGDASSQKAPDPASPVWVVSEVRFPNLFSSLFYTLYSGDPVEYRILLHNIGDEMIELPGGGDLRNSLRVTGQESKSLTVKAADELPEGSLPKELRPGQITGAIFNLVDVVPDITKPGTYTIDWSAGEWKSNSVEIRIIGRFNPEADYEAVLETQEGEIRIDLLSKDAPIHVRNFVNLSRLGYYDEQVFHTSARDRSIRTGGPFKDGIRSIGYRIPAEISSLRHVAGAVSMYRDLGQPGTDSDGSQFFISLVDLPDRNGIFTIFGHIKEGLSVAKKIGARQPSADPALPPGTPKDPAEIHRIIIVEKPRDVSSGG